MHWSYQDFGDATGRTDEDNRHVNVGPGLCHPIAATTANENVQVCRTRARMLHALELLCSGAGSATLFISRTCIFQSQQWDV